MTSVAVVILNYNGRKLLQQFLPTVILYHDTAKVYVVDNGSTDDSLIVLKNEFPQVTPIALSENFGFCGGYNRALQQVEEDLVVILNSDVEVTPRWLDPMVRLFDQNPSLGAVQPKILSYHHRKKFEYAGAGGGFVDWLGYPFCRGRVHEWIEEDVGQYDDVRPVFWASGACFMVKRDLFIQFGGFDEDFFAHMEEIDFCWRLNRGGYSVYYCGESHVFHVGGMTLGYENPNKVFLNFRNGLFLIFKNYSSVELFFKLPLRIFLDGLGGLSFLFTGGAQKFIAVFKAHFLFLFSLNKVFKKRKETQRMGRTYSRQNIFTGLVVMAYFLKKKPFI